MDFRQLLTPDAHAALERQKAELRARFPKDTPKTNFCEFAEHMAKCKTLTNFQIERVNPQSGYELVCLWPDPLFMETLTAYKNWARQEYWIILERYIAFFEAVNGMWENMVNQDAPRNPNLAAPKAQERNEAKNTGIVTPKQEKIEYRANGEVWRILENGKKAFQPEKMARFFRHLDMVTIRTGTYFDICAINPNDGELLMEIAPSPEFMEVLLGYEKWATPKYWTFMKKQIVFFHSINGMWKSMLERWESENA